jgi:indolepyruvate ferredoxin oxidoreductase beta subunit
MLAPDGVVVANAVPFKNIPNYPDERTIEREILLIPNHRLVNAVELAKAAGAIQAANMVMLGAGAPFLELPLDVLEAAIGAVFMGKPDAVIEVNVRAFQLGFAASETGA